MLVRLARSCQVSAAHWACFSRCANSAHRRPNFRGPRIEAKQERRFVQPDRSHGGDPEVSSPPTRITRRRAIGLVGRNPDQAAVYGFEVKYIENALLIGGPGVPRTGYEELARCVVGDKRRHEPKHERVVFRVALATDCVNDRLDWRGRSFEVILERHQQSAAKQSHESTAIWPQIIARRQL